MLFLSHNLRLIKDQRLAKRKALDVWSNLIWRAPLDLKHHLEFSLSWPPQQYYSHRSSLKLNEQDRRGRRQRIPARRLQGGETQVPVSSATLTSLKMRGRWTVWRIAHWPSFHFWVSHGRGSPELRPCHRAGPEHQPIMRNTTFEF